MNNHPEEVPPYHMTGNLDGLPPPRYAPGEDRGGPEGFCVPDTQALLESKQYGLGAPAVAIVGVSLPPYLGDQILVNHDERGSGGSRRLNRLGCPRLGAS